MTQPAAAAVDWGTSSFRAWLLDCDGEVLAGTRSGDGMQVAREKGFGPVLEAALAGLGAPADLPVIVCGMAGARQGWVEVPYVDIPAGLGDVLAAAVRVPGIGRDVRIIPGLAQRDPSRPDVMRGEETQLAGAAVRIGGENVIACLPGTHSKWVELAAGSVRSFRTFLTGDLYAALGSHTILRHSLDGATAAEADAASFAEGVARAAAGEAGASLFSVRAGSLLFGREANEQAALLSGLLIGVEIAEARRLFPADRVTLVATGRHERLYGAAFRLMGVPVDVVDADEAVQAGLAAAARNVGFIRPERAA